MITNFDNWRNIFVTESTTRSFDNVGQLIGRDLIFLDEFGNDLDGKIGIGKAPPTFQFVLGDGGERIWNEQTTVMGQTGHDDCSKIQVLLTTAGR